MSVLIDYSSGAFEANKAQGVGTVTAGTGTYNLAVASYDSVSFSVAAKETIPADYEFYKDKKYFVNTKLSIIQKLIIRIFTSIFRFILK